MTAVSLSSTFFNYAPCLIQEAAAGAAFTAVGVNFVPQVQAADSLAISQLTYNASCALRVSCQIQCLESKEQTTFIVF